MRTSLIVISVLVMICGCRNVKNKSDAKAVEDDIGTHLAIGSSKADVMAFLDQRKIPHSRVQLVEEDTTGGRPTTPGSHTERGIIRDVRETGIIFRTFVSVQMDFVFDDSDSKLVAYSVREVYKGP